MNILRLNIMLLMALAVSGCTSLTSLYFYPQTVWISTPTDFDLRYEDVMLTAHDGTGTLPRRHHQRNSTGFAGRRCSN